MSRAEAICLWYVNSVPLSDVIVCVSAFTGCNKSIVAEATISACLDGTLLINTNFDFLSTIVTSTPLWLAPITVSISQSPTLLFVSTILALLSIETLSLIIKRFWYLCNLLWYFLFLCRRWGLNEINGCLKT